MFSGDSLEEKEELEVENGRSTSQPPTSNVDSDGINDLSIPVPQSPDPKKSSPTGIRHFLRTAAEKHKGIF